MLTDTHSHLYWDDYTADLDQVVNRSKAAGVNTIVTIGVDVETSQKAVEFAKKLSAMGITAYSSIGIHPHEAYQYPYDQKLSADIATLENIYRHNPDIVVLVGECGLDYFFDGNRDYVKTDISDEEFKKLQQKLLQAQIDLAHKLNLPLSIHCRDDRSKDPKNIDCWSDCLDLLQDSRGILHCYSGLEKVTKRAQEMDFLVSFAGNITYPKNQYLRDAATLLPLSKILLETDCPFLAPQSSRGQRNEPKTVREIAELIAELKNTTPEQVATETTQNFNSLIAKPQTNGNK